MTESGLKGPLPAEIKAETIKMNEFEVVLLSTKRSSQVPIVGDATSAEWRWGLASAQRVAAVWCGAIMSWPRYVGGCRARTWRKWPSVPDGSKHGAFLEWYLKLFPRYSRHKERQKEEAGHSRWVGSELNKQGNVHTGACPGWPRESTHLPKP